jgi:hypothetical protein
MQNYLSPLNTTFATPYSSVSEAVATLTQHQLNTLLAIARKRFARLTREETSQWLQSRCEPWEFVHDAIMLVLVEELKTGTGRRTHPRHLANHRTFFNFLQGVVHSRISAFFKKECRSAGLAQVEDGDLAPRTVLQDVVLNEIKAQLTRSLLAFAGKNPALQSTLALLELEAPKPSSFSPTRKQLCKMRRLGREVLREIAAGEDVQCLFQP